MKSFLVVVLLVASSVSGETEFIKGTKVDQPRGSRYYYPTNPEETCKTSPPGGSFCTETSSCNKGNKIYMCTDRYGATEPMACTDPTPYCTGSMGYAKCTAFPERSCETNFNFKCPGVGYFPDLYDCYSFYECYYDPSTKKILPVLMKCSYGYPFSPEGKLDYKCLNTGRCVIPKCSSSVAAEWVPLNYSSNANTMAVYCLNGRPNYVYSCPPGLALNTASLYNSESPYCEVQCTRDLMRAPVVTDNTRFIECRGGLPYSVPCSRGKIFDPYTEQCIYPPF